MKSKIFAIVALTSFIGIANAKAPEAAPVLKGDVPLVAKCMEMHQFASFAQGSADPQDKADYDRFMRENFTDKQRENYISTIAEWNLDPGINKAYNDLRSSGWAGRSLTPALQMAACIKSM